PDEAMLTPASSAVRVLLRTGHQRVMLLGGPALAEPLRAAGLDVVAPVAGASADAVLVGWFSEFTMPALEAACQAVWDGAELYSCSQTPFFAVAGGRALGTSRAISAMIRSLTGCGLQVVGKPSLDALRTAADRLGFPAAQLVVVGDDPHLEVQMALRGRALGIAVGTGLGGSGSYDGVPLSRRPHLQVRGVDELLEMLAGWCHALAIYAVGRAGADGGLRPGARRVGRRAWLPQGARSAPGGRPRGLHAQPDRHRRAGTPDQPAGEPDYSHRRRGQRRLVRGPQRHRAARLLLRRG